MRNEWARIAATTSEEGGLGTAAAAWLAQLEERRSAERDVAGSNPGRTNTQGL